MLGIVNTCVFLTDHFTIKKEQFYNLLLCSGTKLDMKSSTKTIPWFAFEVSCPLEHSLFLNALTPT